jgi:hypothetical protein
VEIVGLLWCNTSNDIQFAELHIEKHLRMYTELGGRQVPSHERMQKVNDDGMEKMMFWQQCSEAQI